jgi:two-component system, OmpR family, response regulator RegX3
MSDRILLVDDDPGIVDVVAYGLSSEGFRVEAVGSGAGAIEQLIEREYDLVVLDVMLPDLSGTEVCRRIRTTSAVPVLMLTARDSEIDLVLGLEVGADDYVTKPFSLIELVSRVRALLRRRELDRREGEQAVRAVGNLRIDLMRHQVSLAGAPVLLTPSEFRILALLASRPGVVFTRRQILEHISDTPVTVDDRACDLHVFNLRRKLEDDPANPAWVLTVRGIGYRLADPERDGRA